MPRKVKSKVVKKKKTVKVDKKKKSIYQKVNVNVNSHGGSGSGSGGSSIPSQIPQIPQIQYQYIPNSFQDKSGENVKLENILQQVNKIRKQFDNRFDLSDMEGIENISPPINFRPNDYIDPNNSSFRDIIPPNNEDSSYPDNTKIEYGDEEPPDNYISKYPYKIKKEVLIKYINRTIIDEEYKEQLANSLFNKPFEKLNRGELLRLISENKSRGEQ